MYQRDYLLRMIEMAARLIAGILGLIRKKEFIKAEEGLNDLYHDILREDAAFFRELPEEKLTKVLLEEHNYTNGHLEVLAELFNAEAELSLAKGEIKESSAYSRKALKLLEFIDTVERTFSQERIDRMETIRNRIESIAKNQDSPAL